MAHALIPIWGESRFALERVALLRDPVFRGEGVPPGDGSPVLLVPGFMAGDATLRVMAGWLRRLGYHPCRARMRANVDCLARAMERLEARAAELAGEHGRPVTVIGQSRGGNMARVLAVRRPDLVAGIVTLGSPTVDPFAVHPLVRAQVVAVGLLGSAGLPGLFSRQCYQGECCQQVREDATAPFPPGVRFLAVYSRSDGIVDWRACLDPAARHAEVRSSHAGMGVHPAVYRAVGAALAAPPSEPEARAAA